MKQITLLLITSIITLCSTGQNVGIGTTAPTEKLDVNGNVNINGALKANGMAGQPGQMLTTNNAGKIEWSNAGAALGYKHFITFYHYGSGDFALFNGNGIHAWTVPEGITDIMIEVWGGGGGGTNVNSNEGPVGGGGGGYARAQFPVKEGVVLNISIGKGGKSTIEQSNWGETGENTFVTVPDTSGGADWYIYGTGGGGDGHGGGGIALKGSIDDITSVEDFVLYPSFIYATGGDATHPVTYTADDDKDGHDYGRTREYRIGGNGGDAGNTINTGGRGCVWSRTYPYIMNGNQYPGYPADGSYNRVGHSTMGKTPGGGAGATGITTSDNTTYGAPGMVIIWY